MIIELTRDTMYANCTVGRLLVNGKTFYTIERPWIPNTFGGPCGEKYVSCIGEGTYKLEPWARPSGEKVFIIFNPALGVYRMPRDVPKGQEKATRTLCLIHAANYAHDVNGCIGPGKAIRRDAGEWMVTQSRDAMNEIRTLIGQRLSLSLVIVNKGASHG